MNPQEVLRLLPDRARQVVYIVYGVIGLLFTIAAAFFAMSPYDAPWWIASGLAALGALVPAFSAIASSNVKRIPEPAVRVDMERQDLHRIDDLEVVPPTNPATRAAENLPPVP